MRSVLALAFALPWLAWAVVRTFGLEVGHPAVAMLAFTPWIAASAWLPVLGALLLGRRRIALLALVAALALAGAVAPRALSADASPTGVPLRVLSLNLEYGRADPQAVMALVRRHRVDVLSLQELTPEAVAALDAAGAAERLPERALEARPGAAGSGLMGRIPLERRPHAIPAGGHAQTLARTEVGGRTLDVMAVHPPPPVDSGAVARWERHLRALPPAGGEVPRLLLGDFNATLDHAELRRVLDTGYRDAAEVAGEGLSLTWPADRLRLPPLIAIDHVLVDERLAVRRVRIIDLPGTDHRAVLAVLSVPRR